MTDVESAYYLFMKSVVDKNDISSIQLLKTYEPLVLQDIALIVTSKVDIVESLLREYDLLHSAESTITAKVSADH